MVYCHKHGQGLATGRCDKCDDELIALGIQADKDRILELESALKDALLFAEWIHVVSRSESDVYKSELRDSSRLALDRIEHALGI
jgi:hypothetical protein